MPAVQDKYQEPIEGETEAIKEEPAVEKKIPAEKPAEPEVSEEKKLPEKKETEVEKKVEAEPEEEKPKKIEEGLEKEVSSAPVAPTPPPSAQIKKQVEQLKSLDRENQIKALSDLSFQKGLDFAIEVAKGLDSAYILDEFHDSLVDELYKKLVEEGKLKKL